jgi:hypothetical protein
MSVNRRRISPHRSGAGSCAQIVRDGLLWNQIDALEGQPDWSRIDSVVEDLRAAGIESSLVVLDDDLPPRFFQGLLDKHLKPKPTAPAFRQPLERLAARCRRPAIDLIAQVEWATRESCRPTR